MTNNPRRVLSRLALLGILSAGALMMNSGVALADGTGCGTEGAACSFTLSIDGNQVGSGFYDIGAGGVITLPSAVTFSLPNDPLSFITVNGLSGNADPTLGLQAAAGTGAIGHTYAFSFDLPISLNGPVAASSTIGYSLTALTGAGAQIAASIPGHKVVFGQDVDTSVGGVGPLDKRVDAGETFIVSPFAPTPINPTRTAQSETFAASSLINVTPAYDTMNAIIAFGLSPNSTVGISGSMSQIVVPEPSSMALLFSGLGLVGWIARRRLVA